MSTSHSQELALIRDVLEKELCFNKNVQIEANNLLDLSKYSDCIEQLMVTSLSDESLIDVLINEGESAVLYTGGGIVPPSMIDIANIKLLHIHPGFLPDIRGADCALWSTLLTEHASASCFYMDSGVDTGDIILNKWLPLLRFPLERSLDFEMAYRLIYSFIDPWLRSYVLREVLKNNDCFFNIKGKKQKEEGGVTFHFMHPYLKKFAIERTFS